MISVFLTGLAICVVAWLVLILFEALRLLCEIFPLFYFLLLVLIFGGLARACGISV